MSVELKVGQVWEDRSGTKIAIVKNTTGRNEGSHPFMSFGRPWTYRSDGGFAFFSSMTHERDLIELVQDENGWRPWKATADSVCPVDGGTLIAYRLFNGVEASAFADEKIWNTACIAQIVAYKIVQEATQAPKPVHAEAHRSPQRTPRRHSHYFKDVSQINEIDVYRVCDLFGVDDPSGATQHAIKKLLCAGRRGAKDRAKDYQEAIDTLTRRVEMWVEGQHNEHRRDEGSAGHHRLQGSEAMKAHIFRELVNDLRDIATQWHGSEQLRERISGRLRQDVSINEDPANYGWIPWSGGECPVSCYAIVEIMFRGGHRTRAYAGGMSWMHYGLDADIVAYRFVTEALNDWT